MRRMRIAVVCDAINNFTGGSFLSALRFSEMLSRKGHEVIVITSRYPSASSVSRFHGMRFYRLPAFPLRYSGSTLYFAYPAVKRIEEILRSQRIELVHFMLPTPLSVAAVRAAKELGIKVVGHSHTQPDNWMASLPKALGRNAAIRLSYRYLVRLYREADAVICPSEFSERLLKRGGLRVQTHVISNGVDLARFRKASPRRPAPGARSRQVAHRMMLYVGRLDPDKNIKILVEAVPHIANQYQNFELTIVGDGSSRKELEALAAELHAQDKVRFLGRVSDARLDHLYNTCDLFVFPSLVELEGMVILEAMSVGKPILVANSPRSASRFFVKRNGFLFPPHNPRDFAAKAVRLFTDDALRQRMGRASRAQSESYDIRRSVAKLENVYASVLER